MSELRRKLSAAAAAADKERAELQYARRRARARREETRDGARGGDDGGGKRARARRPPRNDAAAVVEAKHTRLSIELSAALQKLRETEFEARAETRKLSLSFKLDQRRASGSGGALSDLSARGPRRRKRGGCDGRHLAASDARAREHVDAVAMR